MGMLWQETTWHQPVKQTLKGVSTPYSSWGEYDWAHSLAASDSEGSLLAHSGTAMSNRRAISCSQPPPFPLRSHYTVCHLKPIDNWPCLQGCSLLVGDYGDEHSEWHLHREGCVGSVGLAASHSSQGSLRPIGWIELPSKLPCHSWGF
jgi:hypothetical protein